MTTLIKFTSTLLFLFFVLFSFAAFSQTTTDSIPTQVQPAVHHYPEIRGYVGIVHPLYSWSDDGNHANFTDYYLVGNPWGINIWKSPKFGVSLEFTPYIKFANNDSKLSNFVFHPGVLYRLGHEFTLIGRVAYETSGRYGFTSILNKVIHRKGSNTVFVALLLPARYGNLQAPSYSVAFQFGIGF
ncbi:MAG: hypothetical protein H7282_13455 [Cytophagaceae bacterium]|nr:hypothetical protein [Cytophagaceae bacterium]